MQLEADWTLDHCEMAAPRPAVLSVFFFFPLVFFDQNPPQSSVPVPVFPLFYPGTFFVRCDFFRLLAREQGLMIEISNCALSLFIPL